MKSTFAKIILGNIFRSGLVALITFFITKGVIQADVAEKLMRGDTVGLWSGSISLNLTMIVNVLVGLAVPIVVPIAMGIWSRVKHAYETIVARSQAFESTREEIKETVEDASVAEIITAVAQEKPAT